MGGVINLMNNALFRLIGRWVGFASGGFELSRGEHVFSVPVGMTPTKVWTSVLCGCADGCGQVPINRVGHIITEKQITFYVEVQSESATINWFAVDNG